MTASPITRRICLVAAVGRLAAPLGVGADALEAYDWAGRTGRRHRLLMLNHLAVAKFDDARLEPCQPLRRLHLDLEQRLDLDVPAAAWG
jgi:hypothetical protein